MWIVAGPNGSGKTTLTRTGFVQAALGDHGDPIEAINPDDIAAALRARDPGLDPEQVSLQAARTADARVDACIAHRRSFLIETVLSSEKLIPRVERAKETGFDIGLTFVVLASPDLSVGRVRQRVALHGHWVPEDRVRARWPRSIANLQWFGERADVVQVIDNSALGRPVLLAEKTTTGWVRHQPGRIPAIDRTLDTMSTTAGPHGRSTSSADP